MNWGDFLFGVWIGVWLTVVVEFVALGLIALFSEIFTRLKKLEAAGREEGR